MNQQDVIRFFDMQAANWDAEMICSVPIVEKILDGVGLKAGAEVLDVACGTGIMFPFYLRRGAKHVVAIDISPNMAEIARSKVAGLPIDVLCGDAETYGFGRSFDCVMIYNAFPHFPDPEGVIRALAHWVRPGGTLTVAHGMSAAALQKHHDGCAKDVSLVLPSLETLADYFAPCFDVTVAISDDRMVQLTGVRK